MTLESNLTAAFQAVGSDMKLRPIVYASGPYALDPQRAPAGTLVAVPTGQTILTHTGNRFTGQTVGALPNGTTQATSGIVTFSISGNGTTTYVNTSPWSGGIKLVPPAATTLAIHGHTFTQTDIAEVMVAAQFTLSLPTADGTIFTLTRTSSFEMGLLVKPGATAGTTQYMWNDAATTGSWNYTSPEFPSTARIRAVIAAKVDTAAGGSKVKGAVFSVAADGSETQIGATYEVTAAGATPAPASDRYTKIEWGKLTNQAYLDGGNLTLEAVRVARGAGAYTAGMLVAENLYPAAV